MNQILSTENNSTQNKIQDNSQRIPNERQNKIKDNSPVIPYEDQNEIQDNSSRYSYDNTNGMQDSTPSFSYEDTRNDRRKSSNELFDMRKIIIIFSILAIIFALIIVCVKVYGLVKGKTKKPTPIEILNEPEIKMEKADDICVLKVFYDEGIDKVSFWWSEDDVKELSLNGYKDWFVQNISIPDESDKTLHVKVTASNNKIKEASKNFTDMAGVVDNNDKPEINWSYDKYTKEIIIKASSEKGLVDLSYHWKGEELQTIKNDQDNQKELSARLKVNMGPNWLYATATDTEGNTASLEKDNYIVGVLDPVVKPTITSREDGMTELKIAIHHDSGFEKVEIRFNNLEAVYDKNSTAYDAEAKDIEISQVYAPDAVIEIECTVYTRESPETPYYTAGTIDLAR